ncbi:hypothetical protein ACJJTC_009524 [Scirpophaga incertulas]
MFFLPVNVVTRLATKILKKEWEDLLYENYLPDDPEKQDSILRKLSDYCGKSMFNYTTEDEEPPYMWDFYHSFFFSYTVVSTIGYGNLAPTTHLSRILMIFYGLFGIPINGILLANLGEYFGLQLISVYRKYKRRNEKRANNLGYCFHNLGMLGQIFLYLVPGFLFFIFLPACIFVVFEGWDYVAAVYYAFVTLTTIGFGDLVAGTVNNGFKNGYYFTYQIFLIVWITFGLGYIVMLLGFITSGMRSERVHRLEQKVANQLKSTQNRILQGFTRDIAVIRKIINEANLIKLKPVYVEATPHLYRSASCPNFTFDVEPRGPAFKRKRANSENIQLSAKDMLRIQSDTDLLGIDKDKTFTASALVKPAELLARVVNVLGGLESQSEKGIHMFDDDHILASENPPMFSIGNNFISGSPLRTRAFSVDVPNYRKASVAKNDHESTWTNGDTPENYRKEGKYRSGKLSLPAQVSPIIIGDTPPPRNLLQRLFRKSSSTETPAEYIKKSMKGRASSSHYQESKVKGRRGSIFPFNFGSSEKVDENEYKEKTKKGRSSIFPTFDFNRNDDDNLAHTYKEKTKHGRHSIFPTFDFLDDDDEDIASGQTYHRAKRHSIFPTFDFSDDDESSAKAYKEKTKSGRHSIFPTFDFSDPEDDTTTQYKEKTSKGRHSIFPTFNFAGTTSNDDDDDTVDEEEVKKYQNQTKKGRMSLFPTFGRSKKSDDDSMPESSDELVDYKNKTSRGRFSLFPSLGKDRKISATDSPSGLEASIREYQNRTNRGRNSLFAGDIDKYRKSKDDSSTSSFANELENYKNRTKRGRGSLFDPDINVSELPQSEQVKVLEHTSVADLIRALAVIETATQNTDSPGILDILSEPSAAAVKRRNSLRQDFTTPPTRDETEDVGPRRRRISARTAAPHFAPTLETVVAGAELQITAAASRENRMTMVSPPPPYSETERIAGNVEEPQKPRVRRYSPAPVDSSRSGMGPVPRLFSRIRKDSTNQEGSNSRRTSLTDIVVESNKDNT